MYSIRGPPVPQYRCPPHLVQHPIMEHHRRTPYMETFCGSVEVETGCLTSECGGRETIKTSSMVGKKTYHASKYGVQAHTCKHTHTHTHAHTYIYYTQYYIHHPSTQCTTHCRLLPSIGTTKHFAASSCKEIQSAMSNDCHSSPTSGTFSVNVTDPCGGHVRHMEVGTVVYCTNCMWYMEVGNVLYCMNCM